MFALYSPNDMLYSNHMHKIIKCVSKHPPCPVTSHNLITSVKVMTVKKRKKIYRNLTDVTIMNGYLIAPL